jgi:hypothetical protein
VRVELDTNDERTKVAIEERENDRERDRKRALDALRDSKRLRESDRDRDRLHHSREERPGRHHLQNDRSSRHEMRSEPKRRDDVLRKFGDSREPQRRKLSRSRTPLSKRMISKSIMYVYFFLVYTCCFVYMCSNYHTC